MSEIKALLREKLTSLNLWLKPMAKDGTSLYRCVSEKV